MVCVWGTVRPCSRPPGVECELPGLCQQHRWTPMDREGTGVPEEIQAHGEGVTSQRAGSAKGELQVRATARPFLSSGLSLGAGLLLGTAGTQKLVTVVLVLVCGTVPATQGTTQCPCGGDEGCLGKPTCTARTPPGCAVLTFGLTVLEGHGALLLGKQPSSAGEATRAPGFWLVCAHGARLAGLEAVSGEKSWGALACRSEGMAQAAR